METLAASVAHPREKVDADREAWVKADILRAIKMAVGVATAPSPRYTHLETFVFDAIAEASAIEVINLLGREPSYVNLRRLID